MTATRVQGIPEICHAFRGGLGDASPAQAYENLLAVMESRASIYRVAEGKTHFVVLVSVVDGHELWINALAGRIAAAFEAKHLMMELCRLEQATVIRGRTTRERLRAIYLRFGAVEAAPGDFRFKVGG